MKQKKLVVIVIGVLLVVGIFELKIFWPKTNVVTQTAQNQKYFEVTQQVGTGSADVITVFPGETALGLIKASHKTQVKEYSFGTLVESIDEVKNGESGKYWVYFVNGKMADVGADQYKLLKGDKIEWKWQ